MIGGLSDVKNVRKDIIEKGYQMYNFPGPKRLYEILKEEGYDFTKEEVKAVVDNQETEQAFKPVYRPHKSAQGSIVAFYPNARWQIDIFSLDNLVNNWSKGSFKYAFCAIDIFTRKAWAIPMTHKNQNCVINALQSILTDVNHEKKVKALPEGKADAPDIMPDEPPPAEYLSDENPVIEEPNKQKFPNMITADQDTVFTRSQNFADLLDKYQITFDAYVKGDHNALGVIDSFAKRLKLAIAKYILVYENKKPWHEIMNQVVDNYNNTPNTALYGIKPNEAHLSNNKEYIFKINLKKKMGKASESDLKIGDYVRIAVLKSTFSKSSNPQFGNTIYTVEFIKGTNVKLNNNKTYKRYSLQKVVNDTKPISTDYVQENSRKKKTFKEHNRLGTEGDNVVADQPRERRNTAGVPAEKYSPGDYQKKKRKKTKTSR